MSQIQMEHDHQQQQQQQQQQQPQHHEPYHDTHQGWVDNTGYPQHASQHHPPVQDYTCNGFNGYAPLPMEPLYTAQMHPPPRTTHQQLQPLIMPQWPSMLTSQSTYVPPIFPSAPVPITPASATATPVSAVSQVSASSSHSRTSSTPRKTLTDHDRRRMCQYHEDHPTVKQTEIGAMFGVERSTVSKVLRQKEKYLYQDDGSRSPIKRSKGKFPDIERALSNWARNHQRQGLPLTDAMIREKARFFATTVGSDSHFKASSTSWLEKFKQKNNLMGAKSRKNSIVEESEGASNPPSNAQTPSGISPTSPSGVASPSPLTIKSEENPKTESPDSFAHFNNTHRPFHSQSNTSLSSVFTDTAPSSFSAGPTSPTSPFFTPDSACGPNPFMDRQAANGPPGSSNFQRPRSQTFPMLVGVEQYMSPPASSEAMTPKYINSTTLESPMTDVQPTMGGVDDPMQASPSQSATNSMQPPPVPPVPPVSIPVQQQSSQKQSTPGSPGSTSPQSPSQDEARRALELVMNFFQQQPTGFVEPQEYVMIGKLMEKLKIKKGSETMGGSMRRVSEPDFSVRKVE